MELARDVDRFELPGSTKVFGELAIVDRLVHADVEELIPGGRMVERNQNRFDKILDMNEVPFQRPAIGIPEQGNGAIPAALVRDIGRHHGFPVRSTE